MCRAMYVGYDRTCMSGQTHAQVKSNEQKNEEEDAVSKFPLELNGQEEGVLLLLLQAIQSFRRQLPGLAFMPYLPGGILNLLVFPSARTSTNRTLPT